MICQLFLDLCYNICQSKENLLITLLDVYEKYGHYDLAMKKQNEQNACEACIAILNTLTGIQYVKRESPDELNRQTPDVDFILVSISDESDMIAVEHTVLESFEGQLEYVNRSYNIVGSINVGCRHKIPTDRYYFLAIPPKIVDSLVGKKRMQFVSNLSFWVAETAERLQIDSQTRTDYDGHEVTLMCCGSHIQLNGNVWRAPQQPENQEILQTQRLNRAIEDKLTKLRDYKKRGYKTSLLLEAIAAIPSTITERGRGWSSEERSSVRDSVDYIIVFASNEGRMIVGNVWKEKSVWHSSIPDDRRFSLRQMPGKGIAVET